MARLWADALDYRLQPPVSCQNSHNCSVRIRPAPGLIATRTDHGWRLDGTKQYCSGARSCTDALVTVAAPGGNRPFAISTRDLSPVPMKRSTPSSVKTRRTVPSAGTISLGDQAGATASTLTRQSRSPAL